LAEEEEEGGGGGEIDSGTEGEAEAKRHKAQAANYESKFHMLADGTMVSRGKWLWCVVGSAD
jgi:hypothetical protein